MSAIASAGRIDPGVRLERIDIAQAVLGHGRDIVKRAGIAPEQAAPAAAAPVA